MDGLCPSSDGEGPRSEQQVPCSLRSLDFSYHRSGDQIYGAVAVDRNARFYASEYQTNIVSIRRAPVEQLGRKSRNRLFLKLNVLLMAEKIFTEKDKSECDDSAIVQRCCPTSFVN
jgi:hypothetical protein